MKNPKQSKVSKIQSLETIRSDRDKNSKAKFSNNDNSSENFNYLRYGENISVRENSENISNKFKINNINKQNVNFDSNSEFNSELNINNDNKNNKNKIVRDSTENLFTNISSENNNDMLNSNNYNEFFEEYQKLKKKYKKLKQLYKNEIDSCTHWKSSYFNLLKSSLSFDDTIKTLIEENRIHQEYIINLEKKNQKILTTCTNITNDFHNNLFFNLNSLYSLTNINSNNSNNANNNNNSESLSKLISKNFNELLNDYKKQLDVLSEEKDTLFSNLSLARHQNLQMTLKMEEIQNRIFNLEKLRSDDLIFLDKQ